MRKTAEERFWEKVDKNGPTSPHMDTQCWLWLGSHNKKTGHGFFNWNGRAGNVHRYAWELRNNMSIPYGMQVNHECDNGRCVNSAHLYLGTQADNMADKVARGRQAKGDTHISRTMPHRVPRGERHGNTKLNTQMVLNMRREYAAGELSQNQLAEKYSIRQSSVWAILHRKTWSHV